MIRVVLVGPIEGAWRLSRQPQWMAEVRRDPSATGRPRRTFDLPESRFAEALAAIGGVEPGSAGVDPVAILEGLGALAITGP